MTQYYVNYTASNGQPVNQFGETRNRRQAIAWARECVRTCLLERSGGQVFVWKDAPDDDQGIGHIIWQWREHTEGGFGWHRVDGWPEVPVRGLQR